MSDDTNDHALGETNDYALIVEKEFGASGYRIMVSPVGRILRMVSIRCSDWEETARALMTHAHYSEQSLQECNETLRMESDTRLTVLF